MIGDGFKPGHQNKRKQEGTQVDRPVIDTKTQRGGGFIRYPGHGPHDERLEKTGSQGHQDHAAEDGDPGIRKTCKKIPQAHGKKSKKQHFPVAIPVADRAGKDGQEVKQRGDSAFDDPDTLFGEAQSPVVL